MIALNNSQLYRRLQFVVLLTNMKIPVGNTPTRKFIIVRVVSIIPVCLPCISNKEATRSKLSFLPKGVFIEVIDHVFSQKSPNFLL
jgi:hypothetical protein